MRHPDDFYITPEWCIQAIGDRIGWPHTGRVLDAGAGNGDIGHMLLRHGAEVSGVEMDAARAILTNQVFPCWQGDFLTFQEPAGFDEVWMNPPYKISLEFVQKALTLAPRVTALLRLNWLGSRRRREFLRGTTPDVYVLSKRPSFTRGGTDMTEYAWYTFPGKGRWEVL